MEEEEEEEKKSMEKKEESMKQIENEEMWTVNQHLISFVNIVFSFASSSAFLFCAITTITIITTTSTIPITNFSLSLLLVQAKGIIVIRSLLKNTKPKTRTTCSSRTNWCTCVGVYAYICMSGRIYCLYVSALNLIWIHLSSRKMTKTEKTILHISIFFVSSIKYSSRYFVCLLFYDILKYSSACLLWTMYVFINI